MLATHPKVTPTGTRPSCRRTACVHKRHVGRAQPCKAVAASSKQVQDTHLSQYELIIVGSGNGACAFISKYLTATQSKAQKRILVIEEGQPFLQTSSITHQANWTRSYSEQSIFKLHTTTTGPKAGNRPIISGRAVTQGGGGSINYTMMHESSDWLAQQLGAGGQYSAAYWDTLKQDIGVLFHRRDPAPDRTPVAETLFKALTGNTGGPFADSACEVPDCSKTGYIPQYINGQAPGGALGRVYTFTNQFNDWGERANSGVSLVAGGSDWRRNGRVDLWTDARVEELRFGQCAANGATNGAPPKLPCTGLTIRHLGPKDRIQRVTFNPEQTTVVLAAGSSTPRLLLPHREQLQNYAIGTGVSDHILLPVGFYGLKQDASGDPQVSPKDQYLPLFAEQEVTVPNPSSSGSSRNKAGSTDGSASSTVVVGYDFFAGPVSELSYYLAHLFVSLWMPNALKTACINNPWLFQQLKLFTAYVIQGVQGVVGCGYGLLSGGRAVPPLNVITGIAKFNIYYNGYYEPQPAQPSNASTRIILKCFATQDDGCCAGDAAASPDGLAAMQTLPTLMRKLDIVGNRPWGWAQWLLKKAVAMPYDPNCQEDIAGYVRKYADQHLLTQQHLAGGCVLGAAAEDGSTGPATVGLVKGTANVVVSDLSAVPLPRVSPQMTAYLLGYHIATQRYGQQEAPAVAEKAQLAAGTAAGSASSAA